MISRPTPVPRTRAGFTLIELLTVIAIIGILAAILIPTVGRVRETARRTADASNIRQITQACLIFSNQFNGRLPGTRQTAVDENGDIDLVTPGNEVEDVTIYQFAAALARHGGLNDATLWVSASDEAALTANRPLTTVLESTAPDSAYQDNFNGATQAVLSFMAVSGLTTNRPSTTPVVFTRGLNGGTTVGEWAAVDAPPTAAGGVYGTDGGHIAFLGGNVQFYQNLTSSGARLSAVNGAQTSDILQTLLPTEAVIGVADAPLAGETGTGDPTATP